MTWRLKTSQLTKIRNSLFTLLLTRFLLVDVWETDDGPKFDWLVLRIVACWLKIWAGNLKVLEFTKSQESLFPLKYKSCGRADSENYVNCNVNIQLITQHFVYDTFYRAGKYEICEYKPWQQHQLLILFQPKVRICKLGFMSHLTFSFDLLDVFFRNIISPEIIKKTYFR